VRNTDLDRIYKKYKEDPIFIHLQSSKFIPGEGIEFNPKYLFIGEAPGRHENLQGRPFVGPAGKLLRKFLEEYDITSYFLTNVLKYRPPNNRKPVADERNAGREYLISEINAVSPEYVVILGGTALIAMFGTGHSISEAHGKIFMGRYFCMYHPAAMIYDGSKESLMHQDFSNLIRLGTDIGGQSPDGT
jgi:uracil-DNA glycosylase